jgi:hypothetical protein
MDNERYSKKNSAANTTPKTKESPRECSEHTEMKKDWMK